MKGTMRGGFAAGMLTLTLLASACGYDAATKYNGGGTGYGDSGAAALVDARVFRASGDLTGTLVAFRHALGDSLNRTAGEQPTGRREINWDGVSGALLNVDTFPADFFNRVVARGEIFTTEGTGFRVSDNNLADLNPAYGTQFGAFSPTKIFIAAGSRALTAHFVVAGSLTPAVVNGFGVVFSDVDVERSATLYFYDAAGHLLRRVSAPVRSDSAGFSFVGATFASPIVSRVRIISGRAAITGVNNDISTDGEADLVAMDDFISGEPHPIQ